MLNKLQFWLSILFLCSLILYTILYFIKNDYPLWYRKLSKWIWHRRIIHKIEKELKDEQFLFSPLAYHTLNIYSKHIIRFLGNKMSIETSRILGLIGAILMLMELFLTSALLASSKLQDLILVLIELYNVGSYYKESSIFNNALQSLITAIVDAVLIVFFGIGLIPIWISALPLAIAFYQNKNTINIKTTSASATKRKG